MGIDAILTSDEAVAQRGEVMGTATFEERPPEEPDV